jgi:hypothetical protein
MSVRKRRFSNADASLADMLSEEVIVVDVGSSYIRIGVGGEELPRKVVKMEGGRVIGGAKVKKGAYKGGSAGAAKRIEIDEDGLARIFDRVFHEMEIDPKNHKFVLTRFSDMNPETTAWIKEWLHEEFEVPCVAVVSTAAAILTASSRRTGIVLDIGNRAEVTAICHGADVSGAYKQFWFGGFDLTDKMQQLLARAQIDTSDLDLVRKIKEEHCRLRDHSEDEDLSTRPEAWDDEELHAMPTHRDIPREGLALAPPALWDCPVRARHSLPSLLTCPAAAAAAASITFSSRAGQTPCAATATSCRATYADEPVPLRCAVLCCGHPHVCPLSATLPSCGCGYCTVRHRRRRCS